MTHKKIVNIIEEDFNNIDTSFHKLLENFETVAMVI